MLGRRVAISILIQICNAVADADLVVRVKLQLYGGLKRNGSHVVCVGDLVEDEAV